ncbi:MAG: phosphoenolpyruvate synthase [Bdellovibrionales bacterium]|nr:phosphoenolpyruvate synthase [Bdellovibrionales bacterium]
MKQENSKYIRWFDSLRLEDIDRVGGKNASIGELTQAFRKEGIRVPYGFAVTVEAYQEFVRRNGIGALLEDRTKLQMIGQKVREAFLSGGLPDSISKEILRAYRDLGRMRNGRLDVAVRSSATAEDLPNASFAGQQDSFLNIDGERALLDSVVRCFASLFNDRAISYRDTRGFDHRKISLSVGVQEMVRSDLSVSGVMFTLDPESGFPDVVVINSTYGLGESLVKGAVNPDEFVVFKKTLHSGLRPILKREVGSKERSLVYDPIRKSGLIEVGVGPEDRRKLSLSDEEVLNLAKAGVLVESHFSRRREKQTPMDIEWAKDGLSGMMYLVQARPETVHSQRRGNRAGGETRYMIEEVGPVLARGKSVGVSIKTGLARVIESVDDLQDLRSSEVLVTTKTDPDWEPVLKRAVAVVTDRGGRTCHAAIVSRELGIPAVVGTGDGTRKIKTGEWVTVSTAEGEEGVVYQGVARFRTETLSAVSGFPLKTRVMLNLGRSDQAFQHSLLPNDGVGLARMEFMISSGVGVHPMALVHFDRVKDSETRKKIEELTEGFDKKEEYYIQTLSEQIGTMAAAFFPKPVILRMSDFKSNEYSGLLGGKEFEVHEENPMIGFRGAFRYSHPAFSEGFRLECEAIKRVRLEMGLENLRIMVPFVRTVEDSKNAILELEKNGLRRGESGLEIWMMCEIPSNVILAREFLEHYDGFSIGSNDLTQLLLGVDRDSEILSSLFDEQDPAVRLMIRSVIGAAISAGKPIGICGQAPSDRPEFAAFLVREGITSISLSPDSVLRTLPILERVERGDSI